MSTSEITASSIKNIKNIKDELELITENKRIPLKIEQAKNTKVKIGTMTTRIVTTDAKCVQLSLNYNSKPSSQENTSKEVYILIDEHFKNFCKLTQNLTTISTEINDKEHIFFEDGKWKNCIFLVKFSKEIINKSKCQRGYCIGCRPGKNNNNKFCVFEKVIFTQKECFDDIQFTQCLHFREVLFLENASFKNATFLKKISFEKIVLRKKLDFSDSFFENDVTLKDIFQTKETEIIFKEAILKKESRLLISLADQNQKQPFHLCLKDAAIPPFLFRFSSFLPERVSLQSPRETFLRLKDAALIRHDTILALKCYEKEYTCYHQELLKSRVEFLKSFFENFKTLKKIISFIKKITKQIVEKAKEKFLSCLSWAISFAFIATPLLFIIGINNNQTLIIISVTLALLLVTAGYLLKSDFLLLSFQRVASFYGTRWFRAISWWVIILVLFGISILWVGEQDLHEVLFSKKENHQNLLRYAFHPISIFQDRSFMEGASWWWKAEILNFIKILFLSFLTYEVIKSLRKFSRKNF